MAVCSFPSNMLKADNVRDEVNAQDMGKLQQWWGTEGENRRRDVCFNGAGVSEGRISYRPKGRAQKAPRSGALKTEGEVEKRAAGTASGTAGAKWKRRRAFRKGQKTQDNLLVTIFKFRQIQKKVFFFFSKFLFTHFSTGNKCDQMCVLSP